MRVRKALAPDLPDAVALARRLGLDYPGLESDRLWVAEEGGRIIGLVALKPHADCLELCALGVDRAHRGRGLAKALIEALMAEAPEDVYLATIIPDFFEGCGFLILRTDIPAAFPAKRQTDWCEGCLRERCTVMRRKKP